MRRTALLLTAMMATILLVGGVALAKAITCPNRDDGSCVGTRKADTITGTDGADDILALQGGDEISALGGNDTIRAGKGSDTSNGGDGNDRYMFAGGWGKDIIATDSSGQEVVPHLTVEGSQAA
jgi:hypothetical protein